MINNCNPCNDTYLIILKELKSHYKTDHFVSSATIGILTMALFTPLLQWLEEQQQTLFQHPSIPLILIILPLLILFRLSRRVRSQKSNLPPSPPTLPFIGNLHQIGTQVHRSLRDLSNKYGPLMLLHFGGAPTIVVASREMAKEIMKTHDVAFANRPSATAPNMLLYGCTDVSFSPSNEYWRQIRKVSVTELLSAKRIQSFRFVREEEVSLLIKNIRHSSFEGHPINLSELVFSLSNSIVSRCTLGRKYGAKDGENKLEELIREFMQLLGCFSIGDLYPWLGWMDNITGLLRRMKKVSRELDAFIEEIINEHATQQKHQNLDHKIDFVDILLQVQQDKDLDIKITRDNIKAILMDMFVGGTDTSSTTIEWAIAELVKHPNIMKKAQEEVRRVAAKKTKVEEDDVSQMHLLKSIVKETLRLHPPVPLLVPRESFTSIDVKGYHIPRKTRVIINAWAIQRDSKVWDNAGEFNPDRFVSNPIDFKGQDYEFIPFGSGRRICPAMSFGVAVVEFAIANLLYWFDWELPGGANMEELDMTEDFGITVTKKIPLHLVANSHF